MTSDETMADATFDQGNVSFGTRLGNRAPQFQPDMYAGVDDGEEEEEDDDDQDEDEEEDDDIDPDAILEDDVDETLPPAGLKEISALASWTVSTSKQGCGVAALRSPDTSLFWQSDGPQPHTLAIHFFKLVSIVHMRIYLDHEADESYTPTKMQFWAGMGVHDLQEFAEMTFDQPKGWIDVDFSKVGPIAAEHEAGGNYEVDWSTRPVLRAFLVQVRIIENHQNGKDTHLRGLQIFARDHSAVVVQQVPVREALMPVRSKNKAKQSDDIPIKKASWMLEPELR